MPEFRFDYTRSLTRFMGSQAIALPHPGKLPVTYAGTQISTATLRWGDDFYTAELTDELSSQLDSGILEYTFDTDSAGGMDRFTAIIIYTPG